MKIILTVVIYISRVPQSLDKSGLKRLLRCIPTLHRRNIPLFKSTRSIRYREVQFGVRSRSSPLYYFEKSLKGEQLFKSLWLLSLNINIYRAVHQNWRLFKTKYFLYCKVWPCFLRFQNGGSRTAEPVSALLKKSYSI